MTDQANGGTAKRAHTLSSTLLPAIMHSISSMERRVANEVRLATGAWPGIGGDDASRARELIETYRSDAEKADIEHATLLLAEVARIHEEDLRDTRSATRAILEALRLDPNSTSVQRATFRLLLGTGKHTILAQLVDDLASELETSPGRNAILLDHALTAELSLGHQDRAAYVYQRVVEDDPESLEAIEGLLRVALRLRDWPRVARTARHLASHSDDDQTRRCLLITAALLDTERGEIEHAEWLAQAAALGEKPGVSLPLAVGIFLGNQDVEAALRILLEQGEKHAEKTGQFRFHASWILARSGERDAEAIIHAEAAAEKEPENLLYLSWLADLYDRTARWPDLAEVLKRKAALETTQEEKVETLIARAEVLVTHLGATDDAIVDLEKALEISPTDLACLQALGRLYTQARRYSDLAEMHFKEAERTNDNDRRAHALYRSAQVLDDRLQRRDDAIKHLEEALKTKPSLSSARRLLEELYRKTERYADLVDLYRDKIGQTEDKEIRASLFERIANLLDTQLNDAAGAVDAYEKLLELQPNNPAALSALSRLYHMHGEHTKLLSVLRAQAMTTEGATTRAEILLRMGQILEDDLGQADQALAHYREALDVHPIPSVYEQLGRLLHTTERWPDLIELLEHQIEHETVEKDERVALLFRLGRVHEQHIEDLSAAANAYQRALAENSAYWPAIRGIVRVAHHLPELQRKSLGELLLPQDKEFAEDQAMAQLRIAITLVDKQPVAMRELLAKLVAEGDKGIARDLFVQLLAEVGDHAKIFNLAENIEATAIALGALKDIDLALERSEIAGGDDIRLAALRWRELLAAATADTSRATEALSDRIAGESPGEARVALQLRLVKLLEDDLPAASTACKEIIDEDPTQQRALDLLEHLSRLAHDDTLQDFALGHREEQARTDTERAMVLTIRGHIYTRANKPWKAEDLWRQALTLDPHTRPAYEALKTFYSGQKNAEGLAWTLEQGLDSVLDKNARLQDLLLRADLRRADNNEEGLLRDLDEILEIDPCQPNALERVEAKLREMGDFEALVKRLDAARKTATTPLRKASLEAKLARIYLSELGDTHKAAELLDNAIDRDPDNVAALLISAEVRAKLDQPTEAIALLSRAILRSDDEQELLGAHLATAQIYHEELGVSDRALRSLRTVVELDPDNVAAHSLIAKIAEAAGDDANAEPHLRRLADLETDPRLKALALARLTEVLIREHGTENEEAVTAIAQAADLAPADPDLVQRAVEILKGAQAYERLDGILETAIQVLPEERLSDFLLRRGELLAEHLDRRSEARDLLRRVLAHVPEDEHAIELLIGLMDEKELQDPSARSEVIDLHRRLLAQSPLATESLRHLAHLCEQEERLDEAFCARSALVFLNKASEEDIYFHKQRRRLLPVKAKGTLDIASRDSLVMPLGDHPVRSFLRLLKPHLVELTPPDLSQYGLSSLEDSALKTKHTAWSIAREQARILKVDKFRLVEALGGAAEGATEPGMPPTLVLPRDFSRFPVPQQRFLLGRMFARIVTDTESCDPFRPEPLSARAIELLAAAAIRTEDSGFGDDVASAMILDDMVKRLRKRLPDKGLQEVREAAHTLWTDEARESLESWLHSIERGAHRAGLLCSGNLDALTAFLERRGAPLASSLQHDLIYFTASEELARLRQKLSLALHDS